MAAFVGWVGVLSGGGGAAWTSIWSTYAPISLSGPLGQAGSRLAVFGYPHHLAHLHVDQPHLHEHELVGVGT